MPNGLASDLLPEERLRALRAGGFTFLPGALAGHYLALAPDDWAAFAASWEDLGLDEHMADQGRYRRRRHGMFSGAAGSPLVRLPDAPHHQEVEYNRLNGGIDRRFLSIEASTAATKSFQRLAEYGLALFGRLTAESEPESALNGDAKAIAWQVEAHQFRIEARPDAKGLPTPEGVHRDGVDFVLVALVRRDNIRSGTTTIHGADGQQLGEFTLTDPLDLALVDDQRVWHGVTAVEPVELSTPAFRDVLVLTYSRR